MNKPTFEKYLTRLENNDPTLTELDLHTYEFNEEELIAIANALSTNTSLRTLYISHDFLDGERAAIAIAEALKSNNTLSSLKLVSYLNEKNAKAFNITLNPNKSLAFIHSEIAKAFAITLKSNKSLAFLEMGNILYNKSISKSLRNEIEETLNINQKGWLVRIRLEKTKLSIDNINAELEKELKFAQSHPDYAEAVKLCDALHSQAILIYIQMSNLGKAIESMKKIQGEIAPELYMALAESITVQDFSQSDKISPEEQRELVMLLLAGQNSDYAERQKLNILNLRQGGKGLLGDTTLSKVFGVDEVLSLKDAYDTQLFDLEGKKVAIYEQLSLHPNKIEIFTVIGGKLVGEKSGEMDPNKILSKFEKRKTHLISKFQNYLIPETKNVGLQPSEKNKRLQETSRLKGKSIQKKRGLDVLKTLRSFRQKSSNDTSAEDSHENNHSKIKKK